MDARRFGVGLVAGLLAAFALIAVSGGFSSSIFTPLAPSSSRGLASQTQTAVTSTIATQSGTTAPYSSITTGNGINSVSGTGSSAGQNATFLANLVSLPAKVPSANVNNILRQPPLSNAILFVPVLMALLLGALFYRATRRKNEDAEPD